MCYLFPSGRHSELGLNIKYVTDCIDHQVHLIVEETLRAKDSIKSGVDNGYSVVVHFSKSTLSRQCLKNIQEELNRSQLCPIIGTSNRWYYKMTSTERLLTLRTPVQVFLERQDVTSDLFITEEDWELMEEYVKFVKPFETLSKFLGGENYPASTSVIPALDQIRHDLSNMTTRCKDGETFKETLISNFDKRFKNCFKEKVPFNCLTFLDPMYLDLFVDDESMMTKVKSDIRSDVVYNKLVAEEMTRASLESGEVTAVAIPVEDEIDVVAEPQPSTSEVQNQEAGNNRRASLLAKKRQNTHLTLHSKSVFEKIDSEIDRSINIWSIPVYYLIILGSVTFLPWTQRVTL